MIRDPLAVFLGLAAIVSLSIWLEQRWAPARALGSVLLAIVLAAVASNVGILPGASPTYEVLGGIGVSVGIALILLGVDVRSVVSAGPRMLAAFVLGAAGTVGGAITGVLMLHADLGPEAWKLAGQYTGTYIGGGVNMVAVGRSLETSPDLFSAAVAADNVTTAIWMVACFAAPVVLARWWGRQPPPHGGRQGREGREGREGRRAGVRDPSAAPAAPAANSFIASARPVTVQDTAALAALAAGAVLVAELLGRRVPQVPDVLWLTTVVLVAAQLRPVRALAGGPMAGNYILQLFLAGLGAQSIIGEIIRVGAAVFWFTLVVVGVHGLLLFGVGRMLRLDLPTLAVASQANVGGPASAMALATVRGYPDRLLPGIAVGLLGYAVGNYAGFAVAALARGWVG